MPKIRVLVVEDSLTVRKRLIEVIASDPDLEVLAEAENGQQAIELCQALRPDVITLDMHLPVLDGVSATEHIMGHFPTPILIVSSSTNRGDLFNTYDALAAGAVDVLEKPLADEADGAWERKFLAAIKLVSRIRVITHIRARLGSVGRAAPARIETLPPVSRSVGLGCSVIALGASTGGPGALMDVLRGIPLGLPTTTLIVLHIDEPFSSAFAEWLTNQTSHSVSYARGGEPLVGGRGRVFMAPPGRHLAVSAGKLWLSSAPPRHSCRPSVDVLFETLAKECARDVVACLLTGMGRDGADGLLALRRAGALTIAQDEASSVIYGMPREAALLGAAERILPLAEIGAAVARVATKGRE
ncbi:MAG TPA: chemotaxis-specific protein-glutamate methyltransferase CheB [Polyangiaceae bacterium]|nr:chemotaxis-specific protein-glutamate methyltransferase CheB [Polyangiaceae bacterium]